MHFYLTRLGGEAEQRINGTYEEPINRLELIEGAVLELADILGVVMKND